MKLLDYQNKINDLMSAFVTQIKGATAMGRIDIKLVSENVLIPIFKEVYGYQNLKNLNYGEDNYPGIDLGDKQARVAIQITSTPGLEKVKETLRECLKTSQNGAGRANLQDDQIQPSLPDRPE